MIHALSLFHQKYIQRFNLWFFYNVIHDKDIHNPQIHYYLAAVYLLPSSWALKTEKTNILACCPLKGIDGHFLSFLLFHLSCINHCLNCEWNFYWPVIILVYTKFFPFAPLIMQRWHCLQKTAIIDYKIWNLIKEMLCFLYHHISGFNQGIENKCLMPIPDHSHHYISENRMFSQP